MPQFTLVVTGVELYAQDNIFSVEITNQQTGETTFDKYPAERLEEVLAEGAKVEYDEDDKDLEQALGNEGFKYAELDYSQGDQIDLYLHSFWAHRGEMIPESKYINFYLREGNAIKNANKIARIVK